MHACVPQMAAAIATSGVAAFVARAVSGVKRTISEIYDTTLHSFVLPKVHRVMFKARRALTTVRTPHDEAVQLLMDVYECGIHDAFEMLRCGFQNTSDEMLFRLLTGIDALQKKSPYRFAFAPTIAGLDLIAKAASRAFNISADYILTTGLFPHERINCVLARLTFPILKPNKRDQNGRTGISHMLCNAPNGDYPFAPIIAMLDERTLSNEELVRDALAGNSLSALNAVLEHAYEDGSGVSLRHESEYRFETNLAHIEDKRAMKAAIAARFAARQHYRQNISSELMRLTNLPRPIVECVLQLNAVLP